MCTFRPCLVAIDVVFTFITKSCILVLRSWMSHWPRNWVLMWIKCSAALSNFSLVSIYIYFFLTFIYELFIPNYPRTCGNFDLWCFKGWVVCGCCITAIFHHHQQGESYRFCSLHYQVLQIFLMLASCHMMCQNYASIYFFDISIKAIHILMAINPWAFYFILEGLNLSVGSLITISN